MAGYFLTNQAAEKPCSQFNSSRSYSSKLKIINNESLKKFNLYLKPFSVRICCVSNHKTIWTSRLQLAAKRINACLNYPIMKNYIQ
ncbi:hypothetical protein MTR_8g100025 [Medicago truncatula]|uniref:Uncharacterized protein n=1 Tax=Medicago truncatula TaxID=3880 RepID=A0A072TV21_MEDTR|nr:hypothetical protein MTR_8g100025 [Medicago truncatula]